MNLIDRLTAIAKAFGAGGVQNLALGIGAILVSHGVGRIYAPAGEIVAGLASFALAMLLARTASE